MENYTVYMHITPSGKRYIGITSKTAEERWRKGFGYYKQVFYKAIKKYGWNNIKHEILYTGLTKEEACKKEQILIRKFKTTNVKFGYNRSIGGEMSALGNRFDFDTLEAISIPIIQYKTNGEFLKEWIGAMFVERELNYSHPSIAKCCKGKVKTAYGFIWKYKKDVISEMVSCGANVGVKYYKLKIPKNNKRIFQFTLDGEFVKAFNNVMEACRNSKNNRHISDVCNRKLAQTSGYIWRRENDQIFSKYKLGSKELQLELIKSLSVNKFGKVYQFSLDGKYIRTFKNATEVSKFIGTTNGNIHKICQYKNKCILGFTYRYKNDPIFSKYKIGSTELRDLIKKQCYSKNRKNKINQYNLDGSFVKEWNSAREIARCFKVSRENIRKACTGKVPTAAGFIWKYAK